MSYMHLQAQQPSLQIQAACSTISNGGSITVSVPNSVDSYTYTLEKKTGSDDYHDYTVMSDNQTSNIFNDLETGRYRVTVTNDCGCVWGGLTSLFQNPTLYYSDYVVNVVDDCNQDCNWDVTYSLNRPTTCDATDGSISLAIAGGSGNYSITWAGYDNNDNTTLYSVGIGGYNVTVIDLSTGCNEMLYIPIYEAGISNGSDLENPTIAFRQTTFSNTSEVEIQLDGEREVSATIYNLNGTPVKNVLDAAIISTGTHILDVNVIDLPDGVYILGGEVKCPNSVVGKSSSDLGIKF